MGFTATFDRPWFGGFSGVSGLVPGAYDVAIDGHPYMIDTTFEFGRRDSFRHSSIPATRDATDISNIPGEQTINVQGLWRREVPDWSAGAGQRFYDRPPDSLNNRFRASKGVDVFTNKWFVSLQKDTTKILTETDPVIQVLTVGSYVYVLTSTQLRYNIDPAHGALGGWDSVSVPGSGLAMMATDGETVYVAAGTGGLWTTNQGSGSATQVLTGTDNIYFVAYCGGRLLVARESDNALANVISLTPSGSFPTALFTPFQPAFTWTAACGGFGWIYIGGAAGSGSFIYKTQMEPDGTTLTVPVVAAPLPPGELLTSLFAFVNFILVGTSQGVRFCITEGIIDPSGQDTGLLKIGPIVPDLVQPVNKPVRCFTAQNRFVYFGWSNYDGASTGLGRLDISQYTGDQTPAYATDLMATAQGEVVSCDYFANSPVFAVQGVGIFFSAPTYVPSGTINSGYITFGIPDQKVLVAYSVDVVEPIMGTVGASVTADDGTPVPLGTSALDPPPVFSLPYTRGTLFETTLTLNSGSSNTTTPTVRRTTLQGLPTITAGTQMIVALRLFYSVDSRGGRRYMDVPGELAYLEGLRASQKVISYQEGSVSYTCTVIDIDCVMYERSIAPQGFFNAVCVVTLQTLGGLIT